jgi:hypothetical protein
VCKILSNSQNYLFKNNRFLDILCTYVIRQAGPRPDGLHELRPEGVVQQHLDLLRRPHPLRLPNAAPAPGGDAHLPGALARFPK